MKKITIPAIVLALGAILALSIFTNQTTIDLSGKWAFRKDPGNIGLAEGWQGGLPSREGQTQKAGQGQTAAPGRGQKREIRLPGAIHTQGLGDKVSPQTKWISGKLSGMWYTDPMYARYRTEDNMKIFDFLQPETYYVGAAWYERSIRIPKSFTGKRLTLSLERVHWESRLFVNGRPAETGEENQPPGACRSLATAHEYDITGLVHAGRNTIVLRIDNSKIVETGRIPHSTSDQTMAAWNGVIGNMHIRAEEALRITDVQVYPDIRERSAHVRVTVDNGTGASVSLPLSGQLSCYNTDAPYSERLVFRSSDGSEKTADRQGEPVFRSTDGMLVPPGPGNQAQELTVEVGESVYELTLPLGEKMQLWDEFRPALYSLTLSFGRQAGRTARFGMREMGTDGRYITVNGQRAHIRANLYCGESPLTGLPSMDLDWWKRLMLKHKEYGLNAIRFHSLCPPAQAFEAADEVGIYLQPEVGEWSLFTTDAQEQFFMEEAARIERAYGNSPSFALFALGNEQRADTARLRRFVLERQKDGRHLVSGKINGKPDLPESDFYACAVLNGHPIRHHGGWPPKPENNLLFRVPPTTD